jgi:ABC-type branched-subunit amino acid transport system substrate-binding protein
MLRRYCVLLPVVLFIVCTAAAEDRIKIGLSTAVTGDGASWGNDLKNALLFANQEIASNRYQIIIEDDRCTGKDAMAVAHKLISVDHVKYAFGNCSATVKSALPIYSRANVLVFAPIATSPDLANGLTNLFRSVPSDGSNAALLFEHMKAHYKRVGVLTEEADYAQDLTKAFLKNNSDYSLEIHSESYLTESTDLRSVLAKLKEQKIEALFLNSNSERTFAAVLGQIKQLNCDWQIYASYFPASPTLRGLLTNNEADGIIYTDFPTFDDVLTSDGKKLVQKFESQYGKVNSWEITLITTIEALRALDQAISAESDVKEYLHSHEFTGIFGRYSFDKNGDIIGLRHALKQIKGSEVVRLK